MRTTTVVIGAGHAGLAMSRCLTERSIDHVVLERGEVANTWKTERWNSLTLLTPNWQSRLPGYGYEGDDPDGYRAMPETIAFIERYARVISAPVQAHTEVTSVRPSNGGYAVATNQGDWHCRTVVLASGACNIPHIPAIAEAVPATINMITPVQYRNPDELEEGGVLVVGAAATGVQIAEEIHRSGRPVTLAAGEHIRALDRRQGGSVVDEKNAVSGTCGHGRFGRRPTRLTTTDDEHLDVYEALVEAPIVAADEPATTRYRGDRQAIDQLDDGRPDQGLAHATWPSNLDQGVGLLDAGRENAPRPAGVDAVADDVDAVGEKCGCDRVALESWVSDAVEGEADGPRSIDQAAASRQPSHGTHAVPSGSVCRNSCVTVSRTAPNQRRHPALWTQRSACSPFGLSRMKRYSAQTSSETESGSEG